MRSIAQPKEYGLIRVDEPLTIKRPGICNPYSPGHLAILTHLDHGITLRGERTDSPAASIITWKIWVLAGFYPLSRGVLVPVPVLFNHCKKKKICHSRIFRLPLRTQTGPETLAGEGEKVSPPGVDRARETHQPGNGRGEVHGPDTCDRVLLADARARGYENPPHVHLMGQIN
jgi:hypothetical protein